MGCGVLPEFSIIVCLRQNPAVLNDQGGDRYFADVRRLSRFFQSYPHKREVLRAFVSCHCCLLGRSVCARLARLAREAGRVRWSKAEVFGPSNSDLRTSCRACRAFPASLARLGGSLSTQEIHLPGWLRTAS